MTDARRPPRQEQERASSEVIEVAPGVLRAQLPIDMPGLGHTNCYILEDDRGASIVDPGLPGRATLEVLTDRLRQASIPLARVHTVVVTHSHPDHYGGAAWVRKESGADIVTHRRFELFWDRHGPPDVDADDADAPLAESDDEHAATDDGAAPAVSPPLGPFSPPPWGGEPMKASRRQRLWFAVARYAPRFVKIPRPTIRLDDGQSLMLGGREWRAVYTPGHTNDHLCLFDPGEGVMLSGDHVLPTITPHIGGLGRNDSLAAFFDSLEKVTTFGPQVSMVLPAHGHPFTDLAGRAKAIQEHHEERLGRVRLASEQAGRPLSVQEVSTHLFSPRAQGALADSETFAHLEHLCATGEYRRGDTPQGYRYSPV